MRKKSEDSLWKVRQLTMVNCGFFVSNCGFIHSANFYSFVFTQKQHRQTTTFIHNFFILVTDICLVFSTFSTSLIKTTKYKEGLCV